MRIAAIKTYHNTKLAFENKTAQERLPHNKPQPFTNNNSSASLTFKNIPPNYLKAKTYLASCNNITPKMSLYDFDLNKLNGIQEGLKTFKNLNMKEIAFVLSSITEFAVMRGCHNMCSYCYADAKPPIKERDNYINKMSWEDFTGLTDDIKELNKRLGFYATTPVSTNVTNMYYITPFHDADCIDIVLKDKDGKDHDFIDIYKKLYEATNIPVLFDTAGWFPNNRTAQERAEKFVDYFKYHENFANLDMFNISLNPFHSSNTRSIMLAREGKTDKAEKLRDLYTTRMANVLFTFTPLLKYKNFQFNARAIKNGTSGLEGFCEKDMDKLFQEIMTKLKLLYVNDLNSDKKYVKNKKQLLSNIQKYKNRYKIFLGIDYTEKLKKLSTQKNIHLEETESVLKANKERIKKSSDILEILKSGSFSGIIDANGKYYLTSFITTFPTEIELNLRTNRKQTAPIRPNLQENIVISKNIINTIITK